MNKTTLSYKLFQYYIVMLLAGFFVLGTLPGLYGLNVSFFTEAYRLFVLAISLLIISYIIILKNTVFSFNSIQFLFFLFWTIYATRIIIDILVFPVNITGDYPREYYLQLAFGVVFIPTFCVLLIVNKYGLNYKLILDALFYVIFFTLLFTVYKRLTNIEIIDRSTQIIRIGIIDFGHYGCTLTLIAVYKLIEEKINITRLFIYIVAILIGISAIIISASKSPLLALIASLLFYLAFRFKFKRYVYALAIFGVLSYFFGMILLEALSELFDSKFLWRLMYALDESEDEARNYLITAAVNDFYKNPIFGNSMFIQKSGIAGSYPHNLVLESFMATGFIGGSLFLLVILKSLNRARKIISNNSSACWIVLVFIQHLIFSMVSGNLYSMDLFWVGLILTNSIPIHLKATT